MALKILDTNQYLKIDLFGNFWVYDSQAIREAEKKAAKFEEVKAAYQKIIKDFHQDKERFYYDATFYKKVLAWEAEYTKYLDSRFLPSHFRLKLDFPLMAKYIPNIKDSVATIQNSGSINITGDTLEEVYTKVKNSNIFGATEDC
jgi:hypothetical protein